MAKTVVTSNLHLEELALNTATADFFSSKDGWHELETFRTGPAWQHPDIDCC